MYCRYPCKVDTLSRHLSVRQRNCLHLHATANQRLGTNILNAARTDMVCSGEFIRHTMDDSAPIADLHDNKHRDTCCLVEDITGYSLGHWARSANKALQQLFTLHVIQLQLRNVNQLQLSDRVTIADGKTRPLEGAGYGGEYRFSALLAAGSPTTRQVIVSAHGDSRSMPWGQGECHLPPIWLLQWLAAPRLLTGYGRGQKPYQRLHYTTPFKHIPSPAASSQDRPERVVATSRTTETIIDETVGRPRSQNRNMVTEVLLKLECARMSRVFSAGLIRHCSLGLPTIQLISGVCFKCRLLTAATNVEVVCTHGESTSAVPHCHLRNGRILRVAMHKMAGVSLMVLNAARILASSSSLVFTGVPYTKLLGNKGAMVAERLACSPPTKAIRIQSPAGSLWIFACGNRARRCRWLAGFLGVSPVFPALVFQRCSILTSITLIGSEDLDVKSRQISSLHSGKPVSMEQCRNARAMETGDPRENPPTSGIARYNPHVRKSGRDPAANRTRFAFKQPSVPNLRRKQPSVPNLRRKQPKLRECSRGADKARRVRVGSHPPPPRAQLHIRPYRSRASLGTERRVCWGTV
ncbi:hypothetical protein PR048_007359 [Dryococelus australis]|uniref:Uncharacterized protein n=1 Tax=Dryococelus australis TaxID=614101 RepID=A0ABQ9HU54_9NEOP|nr:hypothetical protein PR048_007359 [Dryococelus australis]